MKGTLKGRTKEDTNVHLSYEQRVRPRDVLLADLVNKYSNKNGTVLDIGCGVGHLAYQVSKINPGLQISVSDIDQKILDITEKKIKVVEAIQVDGVEDLFTKGKKYDVIVMSHVLEHTYQPLDIVCGIMSNLLTENGHLILAVPNLGRAEIPLTHLFKRHYVNKGHVYGWDRSHWINFLETIMGLNVVQYVPDQFPIPGLSRSHIFDKPQMFLGKIFPWMTHSNISVIKASKCKLNNGLG